MLLKYFGSKNGYTLVEILTVVVVLGILTAIAVPVFSVSLEKQKIKDCKNNSTIVSTMVKECMLGLYDNGAPQRNNDGELFINFEKAGHKTTIELNGKNYDCFKLVASGQGDDDLVFTLSDIRGGYWGNAVHAEDYREGCKNGYFLKKKNLESQPFYFYFSNQEIPVCPFSTEENPFYYYILEDGTVICSCPECLQ